MDLAMGCFAHIVKIMGRFGHGCFSVDDMLSVKEQSLPHRYTSLHIFQTVTFNDNIKAKLAQLKTD